MIARDEESCVVFGMPREAIRTAQLTGCFRFLTFPRLFPQNPGAQFPDASPKLTNFTTVTLSFPASNNSSLICLPV